MLYHAEGIYDCGGTNDGECVSSEIASEVIFVLKFIFGLNAARIPGPSVFGTPLAMFRDR